MRFDLFHRGRHSAPAERRAARRAAVVVSAGAALVLTTTTVAFAAGGSLQSDLEAMVGIQKTIDLGTLPASTGESQPVSLSMNGSAVGPWQVTGSQDSTSDVPGSMASVTVKDDGSSSLGSITWTTPAATTTNQTYNLVLDFFAAPDTINTNGAQVTITFAVAGTGVTPPVNHAPSDPGIPYLDGASASPNNTGNFTVDWAASTDSDLGDTVTYTLQKRDADDLDWTTVSSTISTNSYAFTNEAEGSWKYQVTATDNHGASSGTATDANAIVVVDKSNPNAPLASTTPASPAYTDGGGTNWYKDTVTVNFASNGDPNLGDGSAGSGVASVTASETFSHANSNLDTDGSFSKTGTATDNANNVSTGTTVSGKVDYLDPTLGACPSASLLLNGDGSVGPISANDDTYGSGIDTANSVLTQTVDTSTVGSKSVTFTAADNVGHSITKDCTYRVSYVFSGFLQPINDTAHFVGLTTSIFKAGSTVPAKFRLTDANGNVVQTSTAPIWITPLKGNALPSSATVDESTYSDSATTGGYFRWDPTAQQYIFNWNTAKNQGGYYWRIGVKLDDGNTYYVSIGLKP